MTAPTHTRLLSPLDVGPLRLRNRVVSTAHGAFTDFYRPGEPPERYVAYQERRAAGGCGLVILQPLHVHPSSQALGHHVYEPDDLVARLRLMADRLHAHDTPVVQQLIHFGAEFASDARTDLQPLWAFSPIVSPTGGERAHVMTEDEVDEVADAFARTAALAVQAGVDGVELHCAHGYLLQQSVSPWANRRDDHWGDRRSFLLEVIRRTRAAVGPDAAVGMRISLDDAVPESRGGLGPAGLRAVAADAVATGMLDYLNTSWGSRAAHYATAVGGYEHPHGMFGALVAEMRAAVGPAVPVIGMGRVVDPDMAEAWLADGVCDLVAMTRAQIADPDVVAKVAAGEADRIRPCVGANQGCVDRMHQALPITCFHNPDVGREHRLPSPPPHVEERRRVLVVGAGPAGLKAAAVAAARGHEVRVVDAADAAGGRLRWATSFGPAAELRGAVDWLLAELGRHGVEVELGIGLTAEDVAAAGVDAVVLATGSRPPDPLLPRLDGSVPVWTTDEAMQRQATGQRVLVVDHLGTHESAQAAERLGAGGAEVVLATPGQVVGPKLGFTHVKAQLRRLYDAGVQPWTSEVFTGTTDGTATLRHAHTREVTDVPVDVVVAGVHRLADDGMRDELAALAPELPVLLAGDAVAPRTAMHAIRDGDGAGRAL